MLKNAKQGFTLIELLVVVSIIAVIGAGVAVAYNRLDERAKIAMEIADCETLMRAISQKSALSALTQSVASLPNKLDSLIDSQGKLFDRLSAEASCTFVAAEAPDRVVTNLVASGLDTVCIHDENTVATNDLTKLAFLWSGGGAGTIDQTSAILSQIGLTTEEVASPYEDPDDALRDGKTCWLVAFGIGSSSTILDGTEIRLASAIESKRYNTNDIYSRYILLVRVPVSTADEETQVAAVLSPQAMTTAALSALYRSHAEADK